MSTHSYIPPLFNYLFFYLFLYITSPFSLFFFFNDTATTEIYTLSLHDALPIFTRLALRHSRQHDAHDHRGHHRRRCGEPDLGRAVGRGRPDRVGVDSHDTGGGGDRGAGGSGAAGAGPLKRRTPCSGWAYSA